MDRGSEIARWRSFVVKKTIVFSLSKKEVDDYPKWKPTDFENLPVSTAEADKIVKQRFVKELAGVIPQEPPEKYELYKTPVNGKVVWIWILYYKMPGQPELGWGGGPGFVRVPVLLSGRVADINLEK